MAYVSFSIGMSEGAASVLVNLNDVALVKKPIHVNVSNMYIIRRLSISVLG